MLSSHLIEGCKMCVYGIPVTQLGCMLYSVAMPLMGYKASGWWSRMSITLRASTAQSLLTDCRFPSAADGKEEERKKKKKGENQASDKVPRVQ